MRDDLQKGPALFDRRAAMSLIHVDSFVGEKWNGTSEGSPDRPDPPRAAGSRERECTAAGPGLYGLEGGDTKVQAEAT